MRGSRSWLGPPAYYSIVPPSRSACTSSQKVSTSAALSLPEPSIAAKKIGDDALSRVEAAATAAMVSVAFDAHRQIFRHCCNLP